MKQIYNKLRGRITEKLGNITNFCRKMQLSEPAIYSKLQGKTEFTQSQILNACNILEISDEDIHVYFFEDTVKKNLIK